MASVLKVDSITGVTTAGSISVTGEGNSTTTNLQQGLAKAWVLFSMTTPAITDDFNISSLSDDSTGHGTLSFTNAMANATYITVTSASDEGSGPTVYGQHSSDTKTSSAVQVSSYNRNGTASDTVKWEGCFHGDLA